MLSPLDYSLCCQTVTLYRRQGDRVDRTVVENAFYQWRVRQEKTPEGQTHQVDFLLILPGEEHSVLPGDRVIGGIGPELTAREWPGFLPVKVPGLAEVSYVKPCFWEGALCHTEAGHGRP